MEAGILSNWKERQAEELTDFWQSACRRCVPYPLARRSRCPAQKRRRPVRGAGSVGRATGGLDPAAAAPCDSPAGIISGSDEPRWASPEGQPQGHTAAVAEREGAGERGKEGHHRSAPT